MMSYFTSFLFTPLAVIAGIVAHCALYLYLILKRRSLLADIPGPKWASFSRLWIVKALASGRSHEIWVDVNKKHGPVARIGPKHILVDDPQVVRRVLGIRNGYKRAPWFDSIRIDPEVTNIVSERDERKHGAIRTKLAPSFRGKAVQSMESSVDVLLLDVLQRLRTQCTQSATTALTVDIGRMTQFLTVDIITKICLGHELGCVRLNKDMHDLLKTVEEGNMVCQHFSVLLELNSIMLALARVPWIGAKLFPKPTDSAGVGRLMGVIQKVVEERQNEGLRGDVVSSLLSRDMTANQINSELVVALVAGSDTTSTAIQSTLLAIISNPTVYFNLKAEIRKAAADGFVSTPVQDAEAKTLPYLQACVLEGLRKFPPLTQLREREVPPAGDVINGFAIPGGTFVGINAWGTQLDKKVFGEDADMFRPERWLEADDEQLKAMHSTQELIFGYGSTKCLGMSMAMMEITKVVFELFRNFDIAIANPSKPWTSSCYGIFFQKDFLVNLSLATDDAPPPYERSPRPGLAA